MCWPSSASCWNTSAVKQKNGDPAQLARIPVPGLFETALEEQSEQGMALHQIKAIVLHDLGPCRDEVIDELVMRIIRCIDFNHSTQLRV
jgi:hypothetical protein